MLVFVAVWIAIIIVAVAFVAIADREEYDRYMENIWTKPR